FTASNGSNSLTVSPASSTVTVLASNAEYDGAAHGGTASWTSTGADAETAGLPVSYSGRDGTVYPSSPTAPTAAGKYTASASWTGDTNHTGNSNSADYEITKKAVT